MKSKLKIFSSFAAEILPHEIYLLTENTGFQDSEKIDIFRKVIHNARNPDQYQPFDVNIDKRKYHYIKSWIEKKLAQKDVDQNAAWLLELAAKFKLDQITADEQTELIKYLNDYSDVDFNFGILYALAQDYRYYLMIRLRHEDLHGVNSFLEKYYQLYCSTKEIEESLNTITVEITNAYMHKAVSITPQQENYLYEIFQADSVSGSSRYKAFILLTFYYNTTEQLQKLNELFNAIDQYFSAGKMYCRRLLYNYYANRVLLHTRLGETTTALHYGQLSIRQNNEDTLMYVNNLFSIYRRSNDIFAARRLLKDHFKTYQKSRNLHQKITFFSHYLRVQSEQDKDAVAKEEGLQFIKKYNEELFKYRWHHFFTTYLNILVKIEAYEDIVSLDHKFKLSARELQQKQYIPNLSMCIKVANYMENSLSAKDLHQFFKGVLQRIGEIRVQSAGLQQTIDLILKTLPDLKKYLIGRT